MDIQPFEPETLVGFLEDPELYTDKHIIIRNRDGQMIMDAAYWMTDDAEYIVAGLNQVTQKLEVFDKNSFHHLTIEFIDVQTGDQDD